ncbi:MAG: GntR family transcriptional regulator [Burkholderiaceae bacterium]
MQKNTETPGERLLHETVADRLRELIVEGILPPGSRLNERVLAAQLNVSRTPLREAFKQLAGERLVELLPNRGAHVASLSRADVEHLFELMSALEGLSGWLAATRRTEAELTEIRALHFEMLAAHARRDLPNYYRCNHAIHRLINQAARNPELTEMYASVNGRLQSLRLRSNFDARRWDRAVDEHQRMIGALVARDAPGLRTLLEQHLLGKRDAVLAQFDAAGADGLPALTLSPPVAEPR